MYEFMDVLVYVWVVLSLLCCAVLCCCRREDGLRAGRRRWRRAPPFVWGRIQTFDNEVGNVCVCVRAGVECDFATVLLSRDIGYRSSFPL